MIKAASVVLRFYGLWQVEGGITRPWELLRQGHAYLVSNGDGEACESLRH